MEQLQNVEEILESIDFRTGEGKLKVVELLNDNIVTKEEVIRYLPTSSADIDHMKLMLKYQGPQEFVRIMGPKEQRFTDEEKEAVVKFHLEQGINTSDTAAKYGIKEYKKLRAWLTWDKRKKNSEIDIDKSKEKLKRRKFKRYVAYCIKDGMEFTYSIRCKDEKDASKKAHRLSNIYGWKIVKIVDAEDIPL